MKHFFRSNRFFRYSLITHPNFFTGSFFKLPKFLNYTGTPGHNTYVVGAMSCNCLYYTTYNISWIICSSRSKIRNNISSMSRSRSRIIISRSNTSCRSRGRSNTIRNHISSRRRSRSRSNISGAAILGQANLGQAEFRPSARRPSEFRPSRI